MYNELLKQIIKHDNITIFRHARPDGDAVFSSLGLKEFIKLNFKDKKVKLCGFDKCDLYPKLEKVSDKFIKDSLAIILDVSNIERVDDQRFVNAKYKIIIDHHPNKPDFADIAYIETDAAAACEIVTRIIFSKEFSKYNINSNVCKYLLSGILTDSNSFTTSNTTSNTLLYASKLIEKGDLKIADISDSLFTDSYDNFKKITKFRNYVKFKNGVAYCLLDQKALDQIGMTYSDAKNNVNEFSSIKDIKIWGVFAYNRDNKSYDGSVRSRRKYVINTTCSNYNGGGHKNACGVKNLSKKQVEKLIDDLSKIADK